MTRIEVCFMEKEKKNQRAELQFPFLKGLCFLFLLEQSPIYNGFILLKGSGHM